MFNVHHIYNKRTITYGQFEEEIDAINYAIMIESESYQIGRHKVIVFDDAYENVVFEHSYSIDAVGGDKA